MAAAFAPGAELISDDETPITVLVGGVSASDGAGSGGPPLASAGASAETTGIMVDARRPWLKFCTFPTPEEAVAAYLKTCDVPPNWNEWRETAYRIIMEYEEMVADMRSSEGRVYLGKLYGETMQDHCGPGWRTARRAIPGASAFGAPVLLPTSRTPLSP